MFTALLTVCEVACFLVDSWVSSSVAGAWSLAPLSFSIGLNLDDPLQFEDDDLRARFTIFGSSPYLMP